MAFALFGRLLGQTDELHRRGRSCSWRVAAAPPAAAGAAAAVVVVDELSESSPHAAATSARARSDATIQRAFLKVPLLINPQ